MSGLADPERLVFVFGSGVRADVFDDLEDPDDLDERNSLYEELFAAEPFGDDLTAAQRTVRQVIANQIFDDQPPEVWVAAQRLLASGLEREEAMAQLGMVFVATMRDLLADERPFDPVAYAAALDRLPVPESPVVEQALLRLAGAEPGIALDGWRAGVADVLGLDLDDLVVGAMIDSVIDDLLERVRVRLLYPDQVIEPLGLADGLVLTHRLTEEERSAGVIDAPFDLGLFSEWGDLSLDDGEPLAVLGFEPDELVWEGPPGWLDEFVAGALVAVRIEPSAGGPDTGTLVIDAVDAVDAVDEPAPDPALAERLRMAYDREVAEPWLPIGAIDLVAALQLEDPETFRRPRPPLSELAEAAGLEVRGADAAHDASVWRSDGRLQRHRRIDEFFGGDEEAAGDDARFVLSLADVVGGEDPEEIGRRGLDGVNPTTVRRALTALDDELVLLFVADEVADAAGDPDTEAWAEGFADVLVGAATRARDVAAARYLAARVAEGVGETLVAEQHLILAEKADPENPAVVDRLAWYLSDRGDAVRAARLWQRLEPTPVIEEDLAHLAPFLEAATSAARTEPGRNDPCWCGSGRKYKQCHLGELPVPSLADRVPWLCRKSVAYVTRRLDRTEDDALAVAFARTVDLIDPSAVVESFRDPLVLDLVLTEGGWFDEFLTERGPLLPDDEALLAASWLLVERSVHELVEAAPGAHLVLLDLRTGERHEVVDHAFARTAYVGGRYCLRVVPDGEGHQIVGGAFAVAAGTENEVLALLDGGDPIAIARYVADLERPPMLVMPDGRVMTAAELRELAAAEDDGEDAAALDRDDPEVAAILRAHLEELERRWCDEPVPALDDKTPRECAADPTRRDALERLLRDFERRAGDLPENTGTFDVRRVRALLDL